jgi:hypothetical protein
LAVSLKPTAEGAPDGRLVEPELELDPHAVTAQMHPAARTPTAARWNRLVMSKPRCCRCCVLDALDAVSG